MQSKRKIRSGRTIMFVSTTGLQSHAKSAVLPSHPERDIPDSPSDITNTCRLWSSRQQISQRRTHAPRPSKYCPDTPGTTFCWRTEEVARNAVTESNPLHILCRNRCRKSNDELGAPWTREAIRPSRCRFKFLRYSPRFRCEQVRQW
jgi:hypothetical protein